MTPVPTGMSVDFFSASSYGAGATVSGDVKLQMGGKIAVEGRHILVVRTSDCFLPLRQSRSFS